MKKVIKHLIQSLKTFSNSPKELHLTNRNDTVLYFYSLSPFRMSIHADSFYNMAISPINKQHCLFGKKKCILCERK